MKITRIIITVIATCLIFSAWTPTPASAKAEDAQVITTSDFNGGLAYPKIGYVNIENRTGGILYVELTGDVYGRGKNAEHWASYNFSFSQQGKIRFQILPGRYTYTIRSSNCAGKRINTRIFTAETTLGIYTCDKRGK